jgi:hypothetical protein
VPRGKQQYFHSVLLSKKNILVGQYTRIYMEGILKQQEIIYNRSAGWFCHEYNNFKFQRMDLFSTGALLFVWDRNEGRERL